MSGNPPAPGPRRRSLTSRQTVALAALFTVVMLALGWLVVRFGSPDEQRRSPGLWIQTEPAMAGRGQPVWLSARVTDGRKAPVGGFQLAFWHDGRLLGGAATRPGRPGPP